MTFKIEFFNALIEFPTLVIYTYTIVLAGAVVADKKYSLMFDPFGKGIDPQTFPVNSIAFHNH